MKTGIVGWRGMVGSVLMERMRAEHDFDVIDPVFFSTSQAGAAAPDVGGGAGVLHDANDLEALAACEVILTCQGGDYTNAVHPQLRAAGWRGYWIDAASALRMKDDADIILDPVNRGVIDAQALSPLELEVYEQALKTHQQVDQQARQAQEQQLQRLRYQAALAQHQYNQVDPENRLVAAELERRWEAALEALQEAEERLALQQQPAENPPCLPPELKAAFSQISQKLPQIWDREELLPTPKKNALLRCLIDKVVIHHLTPDKIQTRIVWKGGQTTAALVTVTVGAFRRLSSSAQMEDLILQLSQQGHTDQMIAQHLTQLGYTSPKHPQGVLPSTVKSLRLKHHIFQKKSQSHPRHIPGYLTIPQIAPQLDVTPHGIYHLIRTGRIELTRDRNTSLYLFPDQAETLNSLRDVPFAGQNFLDGGIREPDP